MGRLGLRNSEEGDWGQGGKDDRADGGGPRAVGRMFYHQGEGGHLGALSSERHDVVQV